MPQMSSNFADCVRSRSRAALICAGWRDIAEIAIEAASQEQFRVRALERVCRLLDIDASFLHELTASGDLVVHGVGFELGTDRPRLGSYLAELTPDEFRRFTAGRFVIDGEVLPARRKDTMRLYTDCLRPRGFHHYCVRIWTNRYGTFLMTILREGRSARYAPRDLEDANALQSALAVGEALHASAAGSADTTLNRSAFYAAYRLTAAESVGPPPDPRAALSPREFETLQLLLVGLSDKEIADRLGISRYTVNQHTKRIYARFDVHSRATLIARHGRNP